MLSNFFDRTCDIIRKKSSIVGGEEIIGYTTLHSEVPLYLFESNKGQYLRQNDESLNSPFSNFKALIPPDYTIDRNMILDIQGYGRYKVEGIKENRLGDDEEIDSLELTLSNE